jgi:glycosyltransferase involved in cell wall biosynthesis
MIAPSETSIRPCLPAPGEAAPPSDPMNQALLFNWGLSTLFGWGVFGLNLLRHWRAAAGTPVYCGGQMQIESLAGMDPLSLRALTPALIESSELRGRWLALLARTGGRFDGVVLHGLGNRFSGPTLPCHGGLTGRATAAFIFFEDTALPQAAAIARDFAVIVTGSSWCEAVLRAQGVTNVATAIQGVDAAVFHPAPRSGALEGRFAIFSGGKIEFRKGQDLVLLAFRAFARRHPEAVLVTAWHSPWPEVAVTLNRNPAIAPIAPDENGRIDVAGWARANGLPAEQFIDVGSIPNHLMARVLREMDVAVFPNRCEGGTNLVAMECLACGVPTIVSDNTGHQDLIATGAPYALTRQRPVALDGTGTEGWGESCVEEMVEALERVWNDRQAARRRGAYGAATMEDWSWRRQIGRLHDTLARFCR